MIFNDLQRLLFPISFVISSYAQNPSKKCSYVAGINLHFVQKKKVIPLKQSFTW